ncbi:MAG TPA: hypothetical protein VGA69_08105 [Nitriliruptorales bacterium]
MKTDRVSSKRVSSAWVTAGVAAAVVVASAVGVATLMGSQTEPAAPEVSDVAPSGASGTSATSERAAAPSCIDRNSDVIAEYGLAEPAPGELDPSLGPVHRSVDDFTSFASIEELSAASTRAVVGQVVEAPCGRVVGLFGLRNVVVQVEHTLVGPKTSRVTFEQFDWDPSTGRPLLVVGYPKFEVGDRLAIFLRASDAPGLHRYVNDQGVFRVVDGRIADTRRPDPLVREIEGLTVAELRTRTADAR